MDAIQIRLFCQQDFLNCFIESILIQFVANIAYFCVIFRYNSNVAFVKTIILQFFNYIFKYGYIPDNFNVSHIIPIIKDTNKYQHINRTQETSVNMIHVKLILLELV